MLKILLLISSFFFSTFSFACMGPFAELTVLIEGPLPSDANDEMVIAKVELIDEKVLSGTVRVVEAINGVQIGDQFEVQAGNTTCSRLKRNVRYPEFKDTSVSETYYVAGSWKNVEGKQVFFGEWTKSGKRMR